MFLKPATTVCNNALVHGALLQAADKYPHINLPVLAYVGTHPVLCDDFILQHLNRRDIPAYLAARGEELYLDTLVWAGYYPSVPKYVLLINEQKWFSTFKTNDEMVGCFAHELAHMELWGNDDIVIPLSRRLAERVEASKSSPHHFHTDARHGVRMLSENEYVTDALALGRGFGRELSACIKALTRGGRASERCGIPCREIDQFVHARDIVNYRIAGRNEVLRC